MNDYIKRSSVIAYLDDKLDRLDAKIYGNEITRHDTALCMSAIIFFKNIPSESVSEVVRCKDCKFYHAISKDNVHYCNCVGGLRGIVTDDDFCCYGTREDNSDDGI